MCNSGQGDKSSFTLYHPKLFLSLCGFQRTFIIGSCNLVLHLFNK